MFSLQLLGPVVLRRVGQPLPLPTHKVQALLALLALGGATPRARIAHWLWPELEDASARRNLRRELARLRSAGAAELLRSEGEVLTLAPDLDCDALAFAQQAAHDAEAALALWLGPPADGLQLDGAAAFEDWLQAERHRLHGLRQGALRASAAVHEAAGRADAALARIDALLAEDPLQEQAHRDAMRLHAAAGRREAALAQYERCRALLAAELGLAPMAETEALAATLRGNAARPDATVAVAPPTAHWPAELPLVGRDDALATLAAAWAAGRPLLIEGVAGIGKSRLARDFAAAQGAYALAQCRRSDMGVPYASFARVLRRLAGEQPSRVALSQAGVADWALDMLALLLPELGPRRAQQGTLHTPDQQRLVIEACASAWLALAAGNFDTVIVDDWHWCDSASRAVLAVITERRVEQGAAAPRELLVLRPELDETARAALLALQDGCGALHLRLPALGSEQVLELVRRISGAADARRFAQRLESATGGNPFFVAETLRHWQGLQLLSVDASGVWQTPFDDATHDYAELPVPASVRDAVLARVQRLPEAAQRLLEAAALAGEPFAPALLAGACALSEVEALAAIEHAVQAQLLRERERGYAFAHDLVQLALDTQLGPERRRLVHRRLALGAEGVEALAPAQIARHWEAGGEPQRAVAHRIAAAEAAAALSSHEAALEHWQAALDDGPTRAQRLRVLRRRWPVQRGQGDPAALAAAVDNFDALARDATESAEPGTALAAAIEAASICSISNRSSEALSRIDACLARTPLLPVDQARAMEVRSLALSSVGRSDEAAEQARLALQMFAGQGLDAAQQFRLRHQLMFSHFVRGDAVASLAEAQALLPLAEALGARHLVAKVLCNIGTMRSLAGDQAGAMADMQRSLQLSRELRLVDQQREALHGMADKDLYAGHPALAVQRARESVALSPRFSRLANEIGIGAVLSQALCQLGQLGGARDEAERLNALALALDEPAAVIDLVSMVLDLYTLIGDEAGADRLIEHALRRQIGGVKHFSVKLAFNLVFNATLRGDAAAARRHLPLIGDVAALTQPIDRQGAALALAQLALAEGRAADALAALQPCLAGVPHVHTWALTCAAWLAATRALGAPAPDALAAADAALAHERTPALSRLLLRRERLAGADAALATRLRGDQQAEAARLGATLQSQPALQEGFLRFWA